MSLHNDLRRQVPLRKGHRTRDWQLLPVPHIGILTLSARRTVLAERKEIQFTPVSRVFVNILALPGVHRHVGLELGAIPAAGTPGVSYQGIQALVS